MKRKPNGISMEEAEKVLLHYGFVFKRQTGSHIQYKNLENGKRQTIPRRTPHILSVYVEQILSNLGLK